ncbi:MAG: hypothetical protein JOY64_06605 [Alphaproteobacteria bacterium]|nr:hypothetical protein [Alphaproteobacteria bacterium]MBV8407281.1 hypothetical protein [Alphaproteobacteria bacterium]
MRALLAFGFALVVAAGPAAAQYNPGIGSGGRMPETMSPGALPPPPSMPAPSTPYSSVPSTSLGSRYPNTESMARDRVQSRGYQVDTVTRQNNGSWKAEASRDAVPTRPLGVPSRIIIYPDGRVVEEREPLNSRPQPSPPVE